MNNNEPLIEFKDVSKIYHMGDETIRAADHISFKIYKGEFIAIVGQSGSGKSTCMNIIGCLDVPSEGEYFLGGKNVCLSSTLRKMWRFRLCMPEFLKPKEKNLP